MKIIVAIDGPKGKWHPSVENYLAGGAQRKRRSSKNVPNSKKQPPSEYVTFKPFNTLHAITMHLTESPIVTLYVCQQILVLRGMPFYDAIEKAKECVDEEGTDYMKYDNIVKAITNAATKELNVGDNNTEIIFLYPCTNGGVAHNRNMIIHYVYTHMDKLKGEGYTHFHFLDNSGQFGRVGQDKLKKTDDIKSDKLTFAGKTLVYPKNDTEAFESSDTAAKQNKDSLLIGETIELKKSIPGDATEDINTNEFKYIEKTGDYGTRTMSLMNKYYPIDLIKPGFSFINADMNEDLFMQQQIDKVVSGKLTDDQKPINSIQYYNGVGKHVNLIHPFDIILNVENFNDKQSTSVNKMASKWYHFMHGGEISEDNKMVQYLCDIRDLFKLIDDNDLKSDKKVEFKLIDDDDLKSDNDVKIRILNDETKNLRDCTTGAQQGIADPGVFYKLVESKLTGNDDVVDQKIKQLVINVTKSEYEYEENVESVDKELQPLINQGMQRRDAEKKIGLEKIYKQKGTINQCLTAIKSVNKEWNVSAKDLEENKENPSFEYINVSIEWTYGANRKPVVVYQLNKDKIDKANADVKSKIKDLLDDMYVSPLPPNQYKKGIGVVLIPMINYLKFCHPSNSYIIDYTFESSKTTDADGNKTYVKMSADVFGKVVKFSDIDDKQLYYRCGWIYKEKAEDEAEDNYFKTVPVIINKDGIIHLNPRFEVNADKNYKNYLDEIIEINKSKRKLESLGNPIVHYNDEHGSTYDIYKMNCGGHTYTISVNNYAVVYPPFEALINPNDDKNAYNPLYPEAYHAKIFGGANKTKKIMTFIMIVILITVLIIIIVCDGKECKWLQKQIHHETS